MKVAPNKNMLLHLNCDFCFSCTSVFISDGVNVIIPIAENFHGTTKTSRNKNKFDHENIIVSVFNPQPVFSTSMVTHWLSLLTMWVTRSSRLLWRVAHKKSVFYYVALDGACNKIDASAEVLVHFDSHTHYCQNLCLIRTKAAWWAALSTNLLVPNLRSHYFFVFFHQWVSLILITSTSNTSTTCLQLHFLAKYPRLCVHRVPHRTRGTHLI